jgi:hypothetical protein
VRLVLSHNYMTALILEGESHEDHDVEARQCRV